MYPSGNGGALVEAERSAAGPLPSRRLHAEQEAHRPPAPHAEVVNDQGEDQRGHGDDRELERDAQPPLHDEVGEQHDHRLVHDTDKLLGLERITYRIPLYMFIFLVALGSDYNTFTTTRIRSEALLEGLRDGTVKALAATGGVPTNAGIIHLGDERIR